MESVDSLQIDCETTDIMRDKQKHACEKDEHDDNLTEETSHLEMKLESF